jgi:hypothetical protein
VIFSEDFFPDATTPNKNRFASESGVELKGRMVEVVYLTHDERKCDNMLVSARIPTIVRQTLPLFGTHHVYILT